MKALFVSTALTASLIAGAPAFANTDLAKAKNCLTCHAVDKKLVGPSYQDIAAKYKGQADAEAKLAEKVMKGGVGNWGQVPMPPNQVTPDEAKTLVKWILGGAK